MRSSRVAFALSAFFLLGTLPLITAHGDEHADHDIQPSPSSKHVSAERPPSYFSHGHYTGWMYAHMATMILSWVFALPVTIMFSIAQSRYSIPAQLTFHLFNTVGVVTGFIYSHATPDLYANNAHHSLGYVVTSFTVVWTLMSIVISCNDRAERESTPVTRQALARHNSTGPYGSEYSTRWSGDSGQGTERNSASLCSASVDFHKPEQPGSPLRNSFEGHHFDHDTNEEAETRGFLGAKPAKRFFSYHINQSTLSHAASFLDGMHFILEKFLLLLGFAALLSGFVTYTGLFRAREIYNGLAHFVKGGIFFWYGILTLARWMGSFAEFGWAWNVRPQQPLVAKWKTKVPSAEFTESFVIWLYGASNVFMEHMNGWGKEWSAQDFEHVSLTVLFFGGGLLGMLIESPWARDLANTTVELQAQEEMQHRADDDDDVWRKPATHTISLNPMPAIVIMLLGMMMASHQQESMTSTMLHAQWGGLFSAFALARGATYLTLYLRPPTSHYAARPPTELVAAFCLTAGGIVFKLSARDVVDVIERSGFHAMAVFTVSLGLTGMLLAWEVVVIALKGWAIRKERRDGSH